MWTRWATSWATTYLRTSAGARIRRQLYRIRPAEEQLPQRVVASPTATAFSDTPARCAASAVSPESKSSARRLRNVSILRASPSTGPPQISRSPSRRGVRAPFSTHSSRTSRPSNGNVAPGTKGSAGSTAPNCVSTHSRCSAAHCSAALRFIRRGPVNLSTPRFSSRRSLRRRAPRMPRISTGSGNSSC